MINTRYKYYKICLIYKILHSVIVSRNLHSKLNLLKSSNLKTGRFWPFPSTPLPVCIHHRTLFPPEISFEERSHCIQTPSVSDIECSARSLHASTPELLPPDVLGSLCWSPVSSPSSIQLPGEISWSYESSDRRFRRVENDISDRITADILCIRVCNRVPVSGTSALIRKVQEWAFFEMCKYLRITKSNFISKEIWFVKFWN